MSHAGKFVVVIIFTVALAAVILSQWYHYHRARRSAQYFGPTATALILRAKKVELLQLADEQAAVAGRSQGVVSLNGKQYPVIRSRDISATRGLIHMRTGLVDDANFDWDDRENGGGHCWTRALRFSMSKSSP